MAFAAAHGWLVAGGLVAALSAYALGDHNGYKRAETDGQLDLETQLTAELREDLRRVSETVSQNAAFSWQAIQWAIAADAERALQKPDIEIRYITLEKELEQSDDAIMDALIPAGPMRAFNCLLDNRPGTGECDRSAGDPAAGGDGEPSAGIAADAGARSGQP